MDQQQMEFGPFVTHTRQCVVDLDAGAQREHIEHLCNTCRQPRLWSTVRAFRVCAAEDE